jgi:DnaJ-domain-containing protein 1
MELLLGGLLCVGLLGLVALLLAFNTSAWYRLRRPSNGVSPGHADAAPDASYANLPPRPETSYEYSARRTQDEEQQQYWDPYQPGDKANRPEDVGYRVRPGAGQGRSRWDPYAEGESVAERIRAARHKQVRRPASDDYYSLLGVSRDASQQDILRAYRRHAALIHPDKFFDDPKRRHLAEEKLKQLNLAMQVLRDPPRRARYDASLGYASRAPSDIRD